MEESMGKAPGMDMRAAAASCKTRNIVKSVIYMDCRLFIVSTNLTGHDGTTTPCAATATPSAPPTHRPRPRLLNGDDNLGTATALALSIVVLLASTVLATACPLGGGRNIPLRLHGESSVKERTRTTTISHPKVTNLPGVSPAPWIRTRPSSHLVHASLDLFLCPSLLSLGAPRSARLSGS